jgi:hypothetical protein
MSSGARVGVIVDVRVVVGLTLGLGDDVTVGDWVRVGKIVVTAVSLGTGVRLAVGVDDAGCWHDDTRHTNKNPKHNNLRRVLFAKGEKGVMIINFPM